MSPSALLQSPVIRPRRNLTPRDKSRSSFRSLPAGISRSSRGRLRSDYRCPWGSRSSSRIVRAAPAALSGTKAVANAKPDGYTLLLTPAAPLVTAPAIYKNLGYDPSRDFVPVATLFSVPHMLVVHPALPVDSMERLVSYAKANPGKVSYASPGFGTQPHLLAELFRLTTGANIVHVPYKGATPAVTDILAGQVQMYFDSVALFLPHIQAGKLRALAVADDSRNDLLPGVPTTAESGFPELQGAFWACVAAPAGTPETIVSTLNQLINRVLQSPEIEASLAKFGAKQRSGSPQDLAAFWNRETQKWGKIISAAGIKAD